MPGNLKLEKITTANGSDLRQLEIQHDNAVADLQMNAFAGSLDLVWSWQTAAANSGQALGRGSVDTAVATGGFTFSTGGVPEKKAAVTTGTAVTAQTVPADTWALYAFDIAAGGTITMSPAALNTTGYATEALAIAAVPYPVTAKARMGYITVKTAVGLAWIGATDGLAGGSSGNVASVTNYYPFDGIFAPTGTAVGPNGIATANTSSTGVAWTGGRNGVLIPTVLARGSTDTRAGTTAFTYNANGVANIAKAVVAAGTAFGALGTIPADKWGIIVFLINSTGTITYLSGPANYTTGYIGEGPAIGDLGNIFPAAGLCMFGYITIKTAAGLAFIVGTDALAGGTTGNEASVTNYYPTAGVAPSSFTASKIATRSGTVLTAASY